MAVSAGELLILGPGQKEVLGGVLDRPRGPSAEVARFPSRGAEPSTADLPPQSSRSEGGTAVSDAGLSKSTVFTRRTWPVWRGVVLCPALGGVVALLLGGFRHDLGGLAWLA